MKKYIRLSVYWAGNIKSVVLSQKEWNAIMEGEKLSTEGEGYYYEGEKYTDIWEFSGGMDGNIEVYYDDGGTGFSGKLSDEEVSKEFL